MDEVKTSAEPSSTRRDLLKKTMASAVVSCAWSLGLRGAVAQSRNTGKPLLTASTISEMFGKNRMLLRQFGEDPKIFTLSHFSLTPAQERAVAAITPEEAAAIRKGVETALHDNLAVVARPNCGRVGVLRKQNRATGAPAGTLLSADSQSTTLLPPDAEKTSPLNEKDSTDANKVVAQAGRFRYVHEASTQAAGFSGMLRMDVSGFQP